MKTDVQIAQEAKMKPIVEVASKLGIDEDQLELYGKYKAKISLDVMKNAQDKPDGKLILVTAITPTAAGEGKTTTNVGLSMGLNAIGKKAITTLREPSLGPCFGVKGGAAGGGYAQVVPMDDINLHFTGDIHAITTANNLLAALIDNHLHQGNALGIEHVDPEPAGAFLHVRKVGLMFRAILFVNVRRQQILRDCLHGLRREQVEPAFRKPSRHPEIGFLVGLQMDIRGAQLDCFHQ